MQFDYSLPAPVLGERTAARPRARTSATSSTPSRSPSNILQIGVVDDETTGIPTSTNAWGMYTNPKLLEQVGVDEFAGGDWEDYTDWMQEVTDAGGGALWGGTDYTGRIQNFEIQQRAKGEDLFTEDGEPNFTEEDLAAFWEQGEDAARHRDHPAAEARGDLPALGLRRRPHHERADLGQLRRRLPGQPRRGLHRARPDRPAGHGGGREGPLPQALDAALDLGDDRAPRGGGDARQLPRELPEAGEIFGTNRGLPASETMLEGAELDPLGQQISDYEASIADRLGDAPPVPIVGYGTLEEKFRQLGQELGFGTMTVDEAVEQFFNEMDVVLNQ